MSAAREARLPLRVAVACAELAHVFPLELLRAVPGPRGFWGRGERWVAHAGVLLALGAEPGPDRFRAVRDQASGALREPGPIWPVGADPRLAGRLRFYGGFSFQDEPGTSHHWVGFPAALFHLPEVELEGDAEGVARLRVRASIRDGEDEAALQQRLEARLAELTAALTAPPAGPAEPRRAELATAATDADAWEASVERLLAAIAAGTVRKVVLARTLDVRTRPALDPLVVLERLWEANRASHVFYFEPMSDHVLLGAAPETIATLRSGVFHATAVAGTTQGGATPQEQGTLAAGLMASGKDREEHRISLDDILERLGALASDVRAEQEPHVLALSAIQHLETRVRARVPEGTGVLDLVEQLHPTPAVCGHPREQALEQLAAEEPFERGWYAGPVGWFDLEGNGMFAPALRSAVLSVSGWRLFAGAGIVAGSRPVAEWSETGIKFEPVLRALRAAAT